MNNLKKVNKILAFTLLIFGVLVLADYSESASRYYKDKDSIVFDTNLKQLYYDTGGDRVQFNILAKNSTRENVAYQYVFVRNKSAYTQEELDANLAEEYTINVDKNCTIKSVTSGAKSFDLPADIKNTYVVKFDGAPKDNEKVNVEYYCSVNMENDNPVSTNVKIYEQILGDDSGFLYLNYSNSVTKKYYREEILKETGIKFDYDTMIVPTYTSASDIKKNVRTWLRKYIEEYRQKNKDVPELQSIITAGGPLSSHTTEYTNPLEKYIYEKFDDFTDLDLELLGLTITKDDENYTFHIDDKFVGYALTDWHYGNPAKLLYFSNYPRYDEDTTEIFNYYVDNYLSKDYDKEKIDEYFLKIGGINAVISGEARINPMIMEYEGGVLMFRSKFLQPIDIVNFNNATTDTSRGRAIVNAIYEGMKETWPEEFCDENLGDSACASQVTKFKNYLASTRFIRNIAPKAREDVDYRDYLVYHINDKDILISLFHEKDDNNVVTTYAIVSELPEDFKYLEATTVAYLTATVDKDNKVRPNSELVTEIKSYASKLDKVFDTDYSGSITETLVNASSWDNGIQRTADTTSGYQITVTFINKLEAEGKNTLKVGSVPDAKKVSSNPPSTEEPSAGTEQVDNNEPTTQSSDTPQDSGSQIPKKENEEGDDTPIDSNPETTGDGTDE